MRHLFCLFLLLTLGQSVSAQTTFKYLFPNLDGQDLLDEIQDQYAPDGLLSDGGAKDILYSVVNNSNDSVTCVYTGYRIYVNPNLDPSTTVFDQGINLEHTYPRSQLIDGPSERDLHHLFPTLADVNQSRGSLPFRELADSQVDEWYINQQIFTNVPSSNIDAYSEYQANVGFEPREDHKGDVARAMFYVYTIYPGAADASFFSIQRATLCDWHFADPADQEELERSNRVAIYQGTPNPFVIDCTLPQRTHCSDQAISCEPVSTQDLDDAVVINTQVQPQPFRGRTQLRYTLLRAAPVQVLVYDAQGRVLREIAAPAAEPGVYYLPIDLGNYRGLAFYRLIVADGATGQQLSGRLSSF